MKTFSIVCITAFASLQAIAQSTTLNPSTGADRLKAYQQHANLAANSPFKPQWRLSGPNYISGRVTDVWGLPGNKAVIYAAFATSGLWKTTDSGKTWVSLFDKQPTLNFGTLGIAPSNPNIIYAGTGEANIFRASLPGIGVFKSIDGGKSWQHKGLVNTGTIARVVVHPANPNVVYIAAAGNEWSYNTERGVYQSSDGGNTWKRILFVNEKTGCSDLLMDPNNPDILYASFWNRIRRRWSDPVPEPGDYLYKTTDGGKTWKPLTNGLPDTKYTGRVGIAMSAENSNVLYAYIDNHTQKRPPKEDEKDPYGRPTQIVPMGVQVWRSNDKGESWSKASTEDDKLERFAGTYGWVFGQIRVDPTNEDVVYIMGVPLARSTDGGKTFDMVRPDRKQGDRVHGDHHALWIDPKDPAYLINGSDGGVAVTYDSGKTWRNFYDRMPTTHFYNVTYDMQQPFNIYGSVQDQGSSMGSEQFTYGGASKEVQAWRSAPGGEGTIIALDPVDKQIMYASSFYGRLTKSDLSQPDSLWGRSIGIPQTEHDAPLRGEWLAYTFISPHDHLTVYHGMQYLFRSRDSGHTWQRISPDLSYNDSSKMGKTPYAINHQAITAADESPLQKGKLYAGTDDGRVWYSPDDGANWREITKGLPAGVHVSRIVASRFTANRVYCTQSDRREDRIKPYVWISEDNGLHWKNIASNLPPAPVNVIREDLSNSKVLYCGTDLGVYISLNGGASWQSLQGNLPATVSVQDLFIHPRDRKLVIGTYGRGVYILDDLTPLQR